MADNDGSSILWFFAGLGIGAVAGILFAPQSGEETRETLRAKAEEGKGYVRDRAREARDRSNQWVDKGREAINQQKEQIRGAYEAGRQAYTQATGAPEPGAAVSCPSAPHIEHG